MNTGKSTPTDLMQTPPIHTSAPTTDATDSISTFDGVTFDEALVRVHEAGYTIRHLCESDNTPKRWCATLWLRQYATFDFGDTPAEALLTALARALAAPPPPPARVYSAPKPVADINLESLGL